MEHDSNRTSDHDAAGATHATTPALLRNAALSAAKSLSRRGVARVNYRQG